MPASCNGDAVPAGQDWYVSFAWYLDEYGFVGVEGASHGFEGYFWQACGAGVGVAFQGGVGVGDGVDAGHAHADGIAGTNQVMRPALLHHQLHFGGAGVSRHDKGAAFDDATGGQYLPRVHVGGSGVDEAVVAVVENHRKFQVVHRRERGASSADYQPSLPVQH